MNRKTLRVAILIAAWGLLQGLAIQPVRGEESLRSLQVKWRAGRYNEVIEPLKHYYESGQLRGEDTVQVPYMLVTSVWFAAGYRPEVQRDLMESFLQDYGPYVSRTTKDVLFRL